MSKIDCVFLTPFVSEFEEARRVLRTVSIRVHPAATLEQARCQMLATEAPVLLAEVGSNGGWEQAVDMLARLEPPRRALIVVGSGVSERFWISALERGAYDVVQRPFDGQDLRRIIENASTHAGAAGRHPA